MSVTSHLSAGFPLAPLPAASLAAGWLHCILLLGFATSQIPPPSLHYVTVALLTNLIGQSNVYHAGRAFTGGGNLAPITIKRQTSNTAQ